MGDTLFEKVSGVCIGTILICAASVVVAITLKTLILLFNS